MTDVVEIRAKISCLQFFNLFRVLSDDDGLLRVGAALLGQELDHQLEGEGHILSSKTWFFKHSEEVHSNS